jgi:hypothetical protein
MTDRALGSGLLVLEVAKHFARRHRSLSRGRDAVQAASPFLESKMQFQRRLKVTSATEEGKINVVRTLCEHFRGAVVLLAGASKMRRWDREELERKLAQARRLALEPTDPLTQERIAQMVEDLEFQLREQRQVA